MVLIIFYDCGPSVSSAAIIAYDSRPRSRRLIEHLLKEVRGAAQSTCRFSKSP